MRRDIGGLPTLPIAVLLSTIMAGTFAVAQESPKPIAPPRIITKLVPVKNLTNPQHFTAMVKLLENFGAGIKGDSTLRMLSVTGTPESIEAVEAALRRFDVPRPPARNVEITMWVIVASTKPAETKLSAELEPVVKQLRTIFPYPHYQLLDVQFIQAREGVEGSPSIMEGQLADPKGTDVSYRYDANLWITSTDDPTGRIFRLDGFQFSVYRGTPNTKVARLAMNVDVREGQKAVVGKANIDPHSALFVVISAK